MSPQDLGELLNDGRVLAVVAHPDDESFGLGAVLAALNELGAETKLLCFTRGEASTLGCRGRDLAVARANELQDAATVLGVKGVELLDYPDGALTSLDLATLREKVVAVIQLTRPDLLLVFDEGGVTGHPDHVRATEAALVAAESACLPVVAWALPDDVAAALNHEFDTTFCGRRPSELDYSLRVDRTIQRRAIACHRSQSSDNPVLWRRLELLGDAEWLRRLNRHLSAALEPSNTGSASHLCRPDKP